MDEFLDRLHISIKQLTSWGNEQMDYQDPLSELELHLVTIHSLYFEASKISGAIEIATSPDFDEKSILKNIRDNLPTLSTYPIAVNTDDQEEDIEWFTCDSAENLSRIIYELLVVEWHLKNSKPAEALWQFVFCFENYVREHLSNLTYYLSRHHRLNSSFSPN